MKKHIYSAVIFFAVLQFAAKLTQADLTTEAMGKIRARMTEYQREIRDLHTTQEVEVLTDQGEIVQQVELFQKGRKFRVNLEGPIPGAAQWGVDSISSVLVSDGSTLWMNSPLTGKIQVPFGEALKYHTQTNFWNFLDSEAIKVKAVAQVRGRSCYVVEAEDESGGPMIFWVDRVTLDILQSDFRSDEGAFQATFSDFRNIGGRLSLPYHVEIFQNGELLSVINLQSVQINSGLSDQYFNADSVK